MSSAVQRLLSSEEVFLGPASVVALAGATPLVEVNGARVRAELALAFPYAPSPGDELLVIGKEGRHYVIGVLHARGEVSLRFQGDVHLHAVGGKLGLSGDEGVQVRGKDIELVGTTLKRIAKRVVDRADHLIQRVRDQLEVEAGEKTETVDGTLATRAGRATTVTRGVITINGKEVHLN